MGIITEKVKLKIGSRNFKYYKELGYDFKHVGDEIEVKISDLPKHTKTKVVIRCDMCKEKEMLVNYCDYNKVLDNTGNYVCKDCAPKKRKETNESKYGVSSVSQSIEVKERIRQTNILRYGVDNYAKTDECKEKIKQTSLGKYGNSHHLQNENVKKKRYETNLSRYGVKHTLCVPDIRERISRTNIERYGSSIASQSPEIREKIAKTLYDNSSQKSSRQQRYICKLFSGVLNFPVKYYNADIYLPNDNLIVEIDFGGHTLSVKTGKITQEEFNQKEIVRNNVIKREGYKQMRIISSKDYLPSDEILLQLLSYSKEYFSKTSHTWISWDIDNSKMINAENKDSNGVFFDFGELRKIKKSDVPEEAKNA